MGVLNVRNGKLVLQFRYRGQRCREQTQLPDNKPNRNRLERLLKRIEAEIVLDTFDYSAYFPKSSMAKRFAEVKRREETAKSYFEAPESPKFQEFAEVWLAEMKIEWSHGHLVDVEGVLNKYLLPTFGSKRISAINKAQIMQFRSFLAKVPGRNAQFLSPSRINHIMTPLRMILNEAADRYDFTPAWKNIKALKVGRTEVDPFSLEEVERFLKHVDEEYHAYYVTRFFTGMRTGEVDGLMWEGVDLENKTITVSQSIVRGRLKGLKTDGSYRVIQLTDRVVEALQKHCVSADKKLKYVFTNAQNRHLNYAVVARSVWYPTIERAGLKRRNPYQTRHTFATLLLAAGESPEWIANQMGHTTTTMLFRVYSRYVPNLTRRDGSAFAAFLNAGGN
ncbi:site-specific integrase [Vibrio mediterranei]|uniref:site-specific integrase n=1 Tax=Vibrio mediterranei TaxID=689 RepID=UPI00228492E2|nr:site-specific integrase [Vibrio mediterranei]MCY9854728.1 site-specific integrase [Vibrio mediterranei]